MRRILFLGNSRYWNFERLLNFFVINKVQDTPVGNVENSMNRDRMKSDEQNTSKYKCVNKLIRNEDMTRAEAVKGCESSWWPRLLRRLVEGVKWMTTNWSWVHIPCARLADTVKTLAKLPSTLHDPLIKNQRHWEVVFSALAREQKKIQRHGSTQDTLDAEKPYHVNFAEKPSNLVLMLEAFKKYCFGNDLNESVSWS